MIRKKVGTITLAVGLITAGAVLFAQNFIDITIKDVFAYWPVLLIGLGLEMIVYMVVKRQEEENVKIGIDGFCIALIVVLAILSGGSNFIKFDSPFGFHINGNTIIDGVSYKNEVRESYSRDGISSGYNVNKVYVDNSRGNVTVLKSGTNDIKIEADIAVRYNDEQKAKEYAKSAIVIKEGDITEISVAKPTSDEKHDFSIANVKFTIYIPENVSVDVNEKFGSVNIEGINGDINVVNTNGKTSAKNVEGSIVIDNTFGSIELENIKGSVNAETKNGSIDAKHIASTAELESSFGSIEAEDIGGNLKAVSKNGRVAAISVNGKTELESYFGSVKAKKIIGDLTAESKNGSIEAEDITGNVYIESSFGSIKYDSQNINDSSVYAETKFGSINSDQPLRIRKTTTAATAEGTIGSGQYRIELKSSNGSIDIK